MKKAEYNLCALLLIILFSLPLKLFSLEQKILEDNQLRIGFGIGYGQTIFMDWKSDISSLFLPTDFTKFSVAFRYENFRIEPNLGYSSGINSLGNHKNTFSNFRIGSIFAAVYLKGSMNYYYGIDLGIVLTSNSNDSKTDFYVGPVIGAEYLFSEYFSLGGEVQLNYISIGQYGDSNSNKSQSYISTKAIILLRCYFQ